MHHYMKLIPTLIGLCLCHAALAQGKLVDRRDQAEGWYIPVHGEVLVNGSPTDHVEVVLYRDNIELGRIETRKKGRFLLELDIDQDYTIRFVHAGYPDKLIQVDTRLPENLVKYPDYLCFVNLNDQIQVDPFYGDFPSALVRYSEEHGGLYHSDHYLAHLQTKLAGYAGR
jgi:hypothetical protein